MTVSAKPDHVLLDRRQDLQSTLAWRSDLYPKPLDSVPVTDFFGASVPVHVTRRAVRLRSYTLAASSRRVECSSRRKRTTTTGGLYGV